MNIYLASSWRNADQQRLVEMLRSAGHEVYDFRNPAPGENGFSWSDIDAKWRGWSVGEYLDALRHPVAVAGFGRDMEGMRWAQVCVMLMPCGRSAHVEAGWMAGSGRAVVCYLPEGHEPELMYSCFDYIVRDDRELLDCLGAITELVKLKLKS
jgi:hypothetical protein